MFVSAAGGPRGNVEEGRDQCSSRHPLMALFSSFHQEQVPGAAAEAERKGGGPQEEGR